VEKMTQIALKLPVTQDHVSGKRTEWKSPIISPDIEKERGSLDFPLIVRDAPDKIPLSALASKPSLNPESRDSPRILARQQVTSPDRGGLSDSTSRHTSARAGTIKNKTLLVTCWSGLLDACLERAGLREDKDLHSEAWVLVTRATDTL